MKEKKKKNECCPRPGVKRLSCDTLHLETCFFYFVCFNQKGLNSLGREVPGQLLVVPWASAPCRADVLWAGSAPGRRVPAACRSSAAGPTRYPHPAALQIPGNQVWKPRAARSLGLSGTEGRTRAPAASARLLERLAPGRSGHRAGRAAGHPARGRRRGRARFLSTQRARSRLCHSPRLRTGRGTGSPVATGKEREHLAEPASDVGPQPDTRWPPPGRKARAPRKAQTGADRPPQPL